MSPEISKGSSERIDRDRQSVGCGAPAEVVADAADQCTYSQKMPGVDHGAEPAQATPTGGSLQPSAARASASTAR